MTPLFSEGLYLLERAFSRGLDAEGDAACEQLQQQLSYNMVMALLFITQLDRNAFHLVSVLNSCNLFTTLTQFIINWPFAVQLYNKSGRD